MSEYKLGEEYLFSNDGLEWVEGTLYRVKDLLNYMWPYENTLGTTFAKIKSKEKPQRRLYTQSMYKNGEPLEVGMWFKCFNGLERECLLPVDTNGYVVSNKICGAYGFYKPLPFPDPVKLIDKEVYQVTYKDYATGLHYIVKGFYNKHIKAFMGFTGTCYPEASCTNIRPMKVDESR